MKMILYDISDAIKNVIKTFFASDSELMSDEVRQILSNPEDAKKYKDAIKKIGEGTEQSITITLSDNRELTLVH